MRVREVARHVTRNTRAVPQKSRQGNGRSPSRITICFTCKDPDMFAVTSPCRASVSRSDRARGWEFISKCGGSRAVEVQPAFLSSPVLFHLIFDGLLAWSRRSFLLFSQRDRYHVSWRYVLSFPLLPFLFSIPPCLISLHHASGLLHSFSSSIFLVPLFRSFP